MKKLREFLPALFRSTAVDRVPEFKSYRDVGAADQNAPAVYNFKDWEDAARIYNTLIFNVPPKAMADMAFDDYYPAFFFALQRLEKARNAGVGEGNNARVDLSNFKNLPAKEGASEQYSVIEQFYELQEKLKATIDVDDKSGVGSVDRMGFTQAIFDHLDILVAMRQALYVPIKDVPEIRTTALAPEHSPLRDDIVTDRYGSAYSGEHLDELLGFIQWAVDNAPEYAHQKLTQQNSRGVLPAADMD